MEGPMIRALLLAATCFAIGHGGSALSEDLTPEKKADIRKILDMTGALAITQQMIDQIMFQTTRNIRARRPDVPQKVIDALREEVSGVVKDNLASIFELMLSIYHQHFTHEEIKGMIQFYSTDLGRKLIQAMPSIMQESMRAGAQWSKSLEPELERRLKNRLLKEGMDLASAGSASGLWPV